MADMLRILRWHPFAWRVQRLVKGRRRPLLLTSTAWSSMGAKTTGGIELSRPSCSWGATSILAVLAPL